LLLRAANDSLDGRDGLYLGIDTPDCMYDTERFWAAFELVTGRGVLGEQRVEMFVRCAC
jgi:hypothetical protein